MQNIIGTVYPVKEVRKVRNEGKSCFPYLFPYLFYRQKPGKVRNAKKKILIYQRVTETPYLPYLSYLNSEVYPYIYFERRQRKWD